MLKFLILTGFFFGPNAFAITDHNCHRSFRGPVNQPIYSIENSDGEWVGDWSYFPQELAEELFQQNMYDRYAKGCPDGAINFGSVYGYSGKVNEKVRVKITSKIVKKSSKEYIIQTTLLKTEEIVN